MYVTYSRYHLQPPGGGTNTVKRAAKQAALLIAGQL